MKTLRLLLATSILFFASCSAVGGRRPDVSIVNALFTDVNFFETGMQFTLRINNNSPDPIFIDGSVHRITINGMDIGTGSNGDVVEIPRFGSVTQVVRVGLSNLNMLTNIRSLVESKRFDYDIDSKFFLKNQYFPRSVSVVKSAHFDLNEFAPIGEINR